MAPRYLYDEVTPKEKYEVRAIWLGAKYSWLSIGLKLSFYSRSLLQWHHRERPKSVTVRERLILCHCKQLNFTTRLEIGKSEKCHCNQMALYCVTVTSVTVSNFPCTSVTARGDKKLMRKPVTPHAGAKSWQYRFLISAMTPHAGSRP